MDYRDYDVFYVINLQLWSLEALHLRFANITNESMKIFDLYNVWFKSFDQLSPNLTSKLETPRKLTL